MNNQEFSDNFDSLIRSYAIPQVDGIGHDIWGFDEYEKSMFLTQAQEQYVISLYNGKNSGGDKFEGTEEMRRYLHNLVGEYYTDSPVDAEVTKNYLDNPYYGMTRHNASFKSTLFTLPNDLWFITYESVQTKPDATKKDRCNSGSGIIQDVVPVTQDEFHRIKRNPFRGPSYRRALRLDLSDPGTVQVMNNTTEKIETVPLEGNGLVEIISKYDINSYYARYIKKIDPIILVELPEPLKINGQSGPCECKLHEAVHRDILEIAVRLAIASKQLNATQSSKTKDKD